MGPDDHRRVRRRLRTKPIQDAVEDHVQPCTLVFLAQHFAQAGHEAHRRIRAHKRGQAGACVSGYVRVRLAAQNVPSPGLGQGIGHVDVVELLHHPDAAFLRLAAEPVILILVFPQLGLADLGHFRVGGQGKERSKGVPAPQVEGVGAVLRQPVEQGGHVDPVVEPGEVSAGDGPVVGLVIGKVIHRALQAQHVAAVAHDRGVRDLPGARAVTRHRRLATVDAVGQLQQGIERACGAGRGDRDLRPVAADVEALLVPPVRQVRRPVTERKAERVGRQPRLGECLLEPCPAPLHGRRTH